MDGLVVLLLPVHHRVRYRREYSAINSAVDELIPSKHRSWGDINGGYWLGAADGALLTIPACAG